MLALLIRTLVSLRQKYWLPQGRVEVRVCLYHCLVCRRHEGAAFALPKMPPWPKQRVSESLPFQFTGMDYLGPVFVKEGKGITKMWICVYVLGYGCQYTLSGYEVSL